MENKWLSYAKRIQAIAQSGIAYAVNEYDLERFEELRKISAQMIAELVEEKVERIYDLFKSEVGYQTPKVDIRGVVFNDSKVLMVKEKIDKLWSLPGGWADIGYSPRQVVIKEVKEESGLEVNPLKVLAILDKRLHPHPNDLYHIYKIFILCEAVGGRLEKGMETLDVGFFEHEHLPELSLGRVTKSQIDMLFEFKEGKRTETIID